MLEEVERAEREAIGELRGPSVGLQRVEVGVFILLILPMLLLSMLAPTGQGPGFYVWGVAIIIRDASLVCLVMYFAWRNRESLVRIGWTSRGWWKDVLIGSALFLPMLVTSAWLETGLRRIGFSVRIHKLPAVLDPRTTGEFVMASFMTAVVAVSEETVFRGYLMLRFRGVTRSAAWAVALATVIFAMGHGYEGSAGVVTVGFMGLVFALVYLWRRSLVAPVVMHFLQDFGAIVVLPLLRHR